MFWRTVLVVSPLLAAPFFQQPPTTAATATATVANTYRCAVGGFSMTPPVFRVGDREDNWQVSTFFAPAVEGFAPNVTVLRQRFDGDLKAYVQLSESEFRSMGARVLDSKGGTAGKAASWTWVYSATMEGTPLVKRGPHVFLVTCVSLEKHFQNYDGQFQATVASFRFDE
jgi:hypothetical protein